MHLNEKDLLLQVFSIFFADNYYPTAIRLKLVTVRSPSTDFR